MCDVDMYRGRVHLIESRSLNGSNGSFRFVDIRTVGILFVYVPLIFA